MAVATRGSSRGKPRGGSPSVPVPPLRKRSRSTGGMGFQRRCSPSGGSSSSSSDAETKPNAKHAVPSDGSSTESELSEPEEDHDPPQSQGDEYERQRAANIRANMELMVSLGLYRPTLQEPRRLGTPRRTAPLRQVETNVVSPEGSYRMLRTRSRGSRPSTSASASASGSASPPPARAASPPTRRRSLRTSNPPSPSPSSASRLPAPSASRTHHTDANRLGVRIHSPKRFGAIPGIPIGTVWQKRMHCSTDAVHAPVVAGISGNEHAGCWSVCLSGGYEDDFDAGTTFQYTGSGGRDLKGTKQSPKNLRTAPQSRDQTFGDKNAALLRSVQTGRPIRVVRGYKANNRYAPPQGYVYSGLYRCERAWLAKGQAGFQVCKFAFRRVEGQDALPTFQHGRDPPAETIDVERDKGKGKANPRLRRVVSTAGEGGTRFEMQRAAPYGRSGSVEARKEAQPVEVDEVADGRMHTRAFKRLSAGHGGRPGDGKRRRASVPTA